MIANTGSIRPRIPNSIRSLRLRKQPVWSQRVLAEHVGCSDSDISKYERGERMPTIAMAMRIAVVLSVPVDEVFWGWRDVALKTVRE